MNIVNLCVTDSGLNNFLMINRNNVPYKDYWGMLGGEVENQETLKDAAHRELVEEYGRSLNGRWLGNCKEKISDIHGKEVWDFNIDFYHFVANDLSLEHETDEGELRWMNVRDLKRPDVIPSDYLMIQSFLFDDLKKVASKVIEYSCDVVLGRMLYKQNGFGGLIV